MSGVECTVLVVDDEGNPDVLGTLGRLAEVLDDSGQKELAFGVLRDLAKLKVPKLTKEADRMNLRPFIVPEGE